MRGRPGCEYVELPDGGVMWESPAKPMPLDRGDPEDSPVEEFPWTGASLYSQAANTERWWNVAFGFEDVEWMPFEDDAPEDPEPAPKPIGPYLVR